MIISLTVIVSACSAGPKKEEVAVTADDMEFAIDTISPEETPATSLNVEEQKITESKIPDEYQAPPVEEVAMAEPAEPKFEEFTKTTSTEEINQNQEIYHVQKGDTLMMVAFKIYGDYRKWKDLAEWNKGASHQKLVEGMKLNYQIPSQSFGWQPSGLPYLVKKGDTLQIVSMDKYGTTKKWKAIYDNNRPLIRDPNLIFAGFTLYYQPERDLASEAR